MAEKPVQHKPKHLEGEVADPRHPAASSFAPLQPAAGVVADDVEEKGQNLRGGETASDAEKRYKDVPSKLVDEHYENLRVDVPESQSVDTDKSTVKPAPAKKATDSK